MHNFFNLMLNKNKIFEKKNKFFLFKLDKKPRNTNFRDYNLKMSKQLVMFANHLLVCKYS